MAVVTWKIAGAAGEGIKAAGLMLAKTVVRSGRYAHGYMEYPSLIRGGHNTFQVTVSDQPVTGAYTRADLIIGVNETALAKEKTNLNTGGRILGDGCGLNLTETARGLGSPLTKNTIALGASCRLLNLNLAVLQTIIAQNFQTKGGEVIKLNQLAADTGYRLAEKIGPVKSVDKTILKTKHLLIAGNEAIGLGAAAGGLKVYAAYPMTPMSSLLHFLAANQRRLGIAVHHAEDEIGVINLIIGSAYAGARSMTATSGGGFSLMTEGLGLAGVSETPVTIVLGMRPGPATGMPTWAGQGDLLFAVNAAQDEFPRIVLAPGTAEQSFRLAKLAQNLAEKYQLPVIIITDRSLGESYFTVDKFPDCHRNQRWSIAATFGLDNNRPFKRYAVTENGVSPRSLPGQPGGVSLTNSYEHDEFGYATEEAGIRQVQMAKRLKKLATVLHGGEVIGPDLYGPKKAKTSLLCWGSVLGPLLAALPELKDVNIIHFSWLWPFPAQKFISLIGHQPKLISVENNATGQLAALIRQQTGLAMAGELLKYDGRPFFIDELIKRVNSL